jgi:hypothetical protein
MLFVALRQGLKPSGFFRHSSVRDVLRSGAWLRLGAHRNGGGIAETAHPFMLTVSCAVPCALVFPCLAERDEWPTTSAFGVLGTANTRVFRRCSPGNVPTGAEAFPELFLDDAPLPKADAQMSSYLRSVSIALNTWNNTVVFLPLALRQRTRTLFSFQGATDLFYHQEEQPEMQGREATRNPPHHWGWKPRGLRRVPFCQDVSLRILAATNSSVNRIKAVRPAGEHAPWNG